MDAKEVFKDKPVIVAAIEAFEENAKSNRRIPNMAIGGVSFGFPEGPRFPAILVEAYRNLPSGERIEKAYGERKKVVEASALRGERIPAQSPLESFAELASRRIEGNLNDEEMALLEEACGFVPELLEPPPPFDESALREHIIEI